MYYKLFWLKNQGVKIHLHCFSYGRKPAKELEVLCEKVYYYPRKVGLFSNLSALPYNVKSRQSKELEQNLLSNDYPILFEVLHTCYLMADVRFKDRKKIYRHSNIEHDYYKHLAHSEKNFLKKIYLKIEARKLEKFEKVISEASYILAVNKADAVYFEKKYIKPLTLYLPSFHANEGLTIQPGQNDYILYHGNLSVSENYEAAYWLIENVFSHTNQKVIIAGLNPPGFLKAKINSYKNIVLIENPTNERMSELIDRAQIHCLHTNQGTGLKLKLLNVLYKGRFILCNKEMLEGTGIEEGKTLILCNTKEDYIHTISRLMTVEFTAELLPERETMTAAFDNSQNAKKLSAIL
ncbi:MAG: Mannosyltransferase [Bacteroidetes bacterium]|nr:Mannosyltransferase [Bacteroidota bacterium]